nr:MAG TPA: ASCH domain protein [Caudoviricetes sp.]
MKKIMFSDKYCLTKAVLDGAKTMTRRLLRDNVPLGNWEETVKHLPYKVGEVVAIAQSYKDIYNELEEQGDDVSNDWWIPSFEGKVLDTLAGYKNKMFVRSDFMKHHIKITDVKVERLHDISDDDIMREGIREERFAGDDSIFFYNKTFIRNKKQCVEQIYNSTARRAFASLIYKIVGGNTWHSNPFVVAYSFELVD